MITKNINKISDIVKIRDDCDCVWILSDLSHDIASKAFRNWIKEILSEHGKVNCRILYPYNTCSQGRISRVKGLISDYPNKIKCKKLSQSSIDEDSHYMWSQTYGVLFFSNSNSEHQLYISLGTAEEPLYKAVDISEAEASAVNGTLESFWDKAYDNERIERIISAMQIAFELKDEGFRKGGINRDYHKGKAQSTPAAQGINSKAG